MLSSIEKLPAVVHYRAAGEVLRKLKQHHNRRNGVKALRESIASQLGATGVIHGSGLHYTLKFDKPLNDSSRRRWRPYRLSDLGQGYVPRRDNKVGLRYYHKLYAPETHLLNRYDLANSLGIPVFFDGQQFLAPCCKIISPSHWILSAPAGFSFADCSPLNVEEFAEAITSE